MRPPAIEKMGYYPTDLPVLEMLVTAIAPSENSKGRLLDPCAGEGIAASFLGKALNCETWGAELSPARAAIAVTVMDKLYTTAWQSCNLTDEAVSLLFLNPPYDYDRLDNRKRLEIEFLKSTTPKLMKTGLLVYIIPQRILGMEEAARFLSGHYDDLKVMRFPEGLFEKFHQVVVTGTRRLAYKLPKDEEVKQIQDWANQDLPVLEKVETPAYQLLAGPSINPAGKAVMFKRTDWEPDEIACAASRLGVHHSKEWADLIHPNRNLVTSMNPVMPLKKGHIAMLMASGMMGTVRLNDDDGHPMLVKGRVIKVVEKTEEADPQNDDVVVERYKDRFVTTVSILTRFGIKVIQDVANLADFMKTYGDRIAAHVLATYTPLYKFDPTAKETAILDTLGTLRKPLPGQEQAGLLPTQRHAAIAMARAIQKHKVGNMQGEMGIGKSTIGAAVIELLDAYPALVICPPHLVPKWIREIEEVIPGAHAVELRKIGRSAEDAGDVNDVETFLSGYHTAKVSQPGKIPKWVAVVAHTAAKMGSGWQPATMWRATRHPITGKPVKACACPSCGGIVMKQELGMLVPVTDVNDIASRRQFCTYQVTGWEKNGRGKAEPAWGTHRCGTPLFQFGGARRHAIADYIAKQAKGEFKLLVGDEVHQFKSKSSDRGVAFHQLVTACDQTLTLTGTFFGGKSTSIFWLLHRLNSGVRRDFGFNDETRWARLYGVLETSRRRHRGDDEEDGVYTGNRRYRNQAKEMPGVSPAIINRLLENTVFLSLKDLGLALPTYNEEVVTLDMLMDQDDQYHNMDMTLRQMAIQSNRYLSMWLQWSLARPNSSFRDEVVLIDQVEKDGKTVRKVPFMELPAVVSTENWLPKEDWLARYCRDEKRQERKVLVYVRQTGTRDIQDRIVASLEAKGLRALVLSGNINPRQRESWIEKHAENLDVLVCNPKLVETGLDLVQFSTIVFAEIEYSLVRRMTA